MPYSSIDELPENTKSLPKHAKEIFLASFNSAIAQGNSEESAFKIAWSAVSKSYEKVDGKWQAIGNMQIFSNAEIINSEHDVTLNRLNQMLVYPDGSSVFYPVKFFQEFGNKWEGIPIIFGKDHPDFDLYTQNPELALKQIGGSIVGKVTNPRVELTGTPRFVAKFQIDNPVIENLIQAGKLAHSTGFQGHTDTQKQLISMIPHHVLVFEQNKYNNPVDAGAMILNKKESEELDIENKDPKKPYGDVEYADPGYQEFGIEIKNKETDMANQTKDNIKNALKDLQSHPEMMDDEMKTMMKDMKNKEQETKDTMGKEDELTKQLEISNKEKETLTGQVEGLKKEIANKTEQLKVFEQKEAERIKATTESRWQTIVNSFPKGIRDDASRVTKLRTEFETDAQGFTLTMLEIKNAEARVIAGLPGEEGKAIANSDPNTEGAVKAGMTKLGIPSITFTTGDSKTEEVT